MAEKYQVTFPADADIPTVKLTSVENVLGRWVKIPTALTTEEVTAPNSTQDLLADLYWELYKAHPESKEHIPDVRTVNKAVLDMVKESPDWENTRIQTSASISMSSLCASGLLMNLLENDQIKEALEKQEQAQQLDEQSQRDPNQKGENDQKKRELIEQAMKGLGRGDKSSGDQEKDTQHGVSSAVHKAKDETDEAMQIAKSWGMDDPENREINIKEVLRMRDYYKQNRDIQTVTSHMGRVKGVSMETREQSSKVKGVVITQDGYTQNMHRLFPAELALLRKDVNPLVRAQKASEYCDRGLLGMKEESHPEKCGPLVVAVDESGSMSGDGVLKAKGLAIGVCQSALDNGQPFSVFGFSNHANDPISSDDPKMKLMHWATEYANGGTSFTNALEQAMDIIKKSEHRHSSDIVFITDGQDEISSTTVERFKELTDEYGTRLICFGIDTCGHNSDLFEIAHAYIDIDDLSDLDSLSEILTSKLLENNRHG